MLAIFQPGTSLTWDLLWQSSLFLAIGLGTSALLRRHPARAHRVLILTLARRPADADRGPGGPAGRMGRAGQHDGRREDRDGSLTRG